MNILFLSLISNDSIDSHDIYTDLLRSLAKTNNVFMVSPVERRNGKKTYKINYDTYNDWHKNVHILKIKTFNIQKTNSIEKLLGIMLLKRQFIQEIKRKFKGIKFDLILYPTPPITLYGVVKYFKKRDSSKTYLMLKDIFPQNALDIGLLNEKGLRGLVYRHFKKIENKLYSISDKIGCMSQANVDYILTKYRIDESKVEIFPNCIEPFDFENNSDSFTSLRKKYNIPLDKKVFVYGGNLGLPQNIPFVIQCIRSLKNYKDVFFLIVGDGTEYESLRLFKEKEKQLNFSLIQRIPKSDFDSLMTVCDVGLIFLDYRFTIPNFPSRLLSYLQASIPVIACTDNVSDIGTIVENGGFGWRCSSSSIESFQRIVDACLKSDLKAMGRNGKEYLMANYTIDRNVSKIIKFCQE